MVSLVSEILVSLLEASKSLPRRRAGKRPNIATLYRWTNEGVRGIRLEFLQVGGTRCTSKEALQRFFDALTAQAEPHPVASPPRQTRQRRQQIEAAERRLATAGI
jgi:hypothetical protein